mmetsp:Transcript_9931/g.24844  ORF Transcript_9931/g.24844 Transcript_9931/m.24844 type:complete len:225 (+) Transcript_9931:434-1108(+)
MPDRYCVPWSAPCLLSVVGSCFSQNTSSSSSYVTAPLSYVTCTTSQCPVLPLHTSSYVGSSVLPLLYPTSVVTTPGTRWNTSSGPQKQPMPNVALPRRSAGVSAMSSTSKVRLLPASSWFRSSSTSLSSSLVHLAIMPLDSCTCMPALSPSGACAAGNLSTMPGSGWPYASSGATRSLRLSPTARPVTALSKPLITMPPPTMNSSGVPRLRDVSNTEPSSRVPV